MEFCEKKEDRVERMEQNGHNRLDRIIMLRVGEQAHEAGMPGRAVGTGMLGLGG